MTARIEIATLDVDYDAFAVLVREYWTWLQNRYLDLPGFIDSVGGHQSLDAELDMLSSIYGPPAGRVLLAYQGTDIAGGVAMKDLHDGSCEMKRLYVPERFQCHGTGRLLVRTLIDVATSDGFRLMRLDTGEHNSEAIAMYESMGFVHCSPHQAYPNELMTHLRFMERPLVDG
jgi:putative acetyltransferase